MLKKHLSMLWFFGSLLSVSILVCLYSFGYMSTESPQGIITGKVIDETGAVLPGVTVTLTSPALIGARTAVTSAEGHYQFVDLLPGLYKLTYELEGFTTVVSEDIRITTALVTRVNVTLAIGAVEEQITVTAEPLEEEEAPPPTEEEAPPPAQPDLSEIIEDELDKLVLGKIIFNPAQEMKVNVIERIEVRITKKDTEDLFAGLRGRGVPQIEEIRVGTFMKVRLTGHNFDIKPLSHEEQPVTGEGITQWEWDVIPLKSGIQTLLLAVAVRIKIPNYDEETIDYPVFERKIKVKVNIITWFAKHWKLFLTKIIAPIIVGIIVAWLVHKLRGSKKK